jgi:cytochrome P450
MARMPLPAIAPMPPRAAGRLPWVGAGLGLLRNPTAFFRRTRAALGDTFVVDAFGYRMFSVFSPQGVQALYALPEHEASFGLATYELVMRRKLPTELVIGRRNRPHDLFGAQEVEDYLEHLEWAVAQQIDELGAAGTFEIFALMRRLGHRLGLAAWAGREAAASPWLDRLIPLLDTLDQGDSFVRPIRTLAAVATGKVRERRAMRGIEAIVAAVLDDRRTRGVAPGDYLDRIAASFADLPPDERAVNVARDLMLIHMGAQSNLYAALAWTVVNLLDHPAVLARVVAGDDTLLEQCANESIRLAQRSITLRQVLRPLTFTVEHGQHALAPGVMIATMLSVTNTTAAPGLADFDPDHYEGRRLRAAACPVARELVSTFGHGRHSCPAQRFSISAIRISLRRLLDRYRLEARFREAAPLARQLGGVARAAAPCVVAYRAR